MAEYLAQISNQANWLMVYDEYREVELLPSGDYIPFPNFELPILFDKPLLAVRCSVQGAPFSWRFAGNLTQKFNVGSGGAASTLPWVEARRVPLRINRSELVYFQMLVPDYELILDSPYWLQNLRLTVWQYTGEISSETEAILAKISPQLDRIEAALQP